MCIYKFTPCKIFMSCRVFSDALISARPQSRLPAGVIFCAAMICPWLVPVACGSGRLRLFSFYKMLFFKANPPGAALPCSCARGMLFGKGFCRLRREIPAEHALDKMGQHREEADRKCGHRQQCSGHRRCERHKGEKGVERQHCDKKSGCHRVK